MLRISLTETEFQALVKLLDAGARASGLAASREAAALLDRLDAAERIDAPQPDQSAAPPA